MVVRWEGAAPIVVGCYGDRRVNVAGGRVDAGGSMQSPRNRNRSQRGQVHKVPEVEGPQERPIARTRGAGRAAELVSATTNTDAGSTMRVTSSHICAHHPNLTWGSQPMLIQGAWAAST